MTTLDPPRTARIDAATVSLHGTAVAHLGRALVLCGPAGAGKSGMAAQMIALGAGLVCDDLCLLRRVGCGLEARRPPAAPRAIELRGVGIAALDGPDAAPLAGLWCIGPSAGRLPDPEAVEILGLPVRVLRHPRAADAAAKAMVWLAAADA